MSECPEYRVRLFLTVDLVGSTAFKSNSDATADDLYPLWVDKFKQFYQQFPISLDSSFRESKSCRVDGLDVASGPKLWKIIGDEILFCCSVVSLRHLSCCVTAFLTALEEYGQLLEDEAIPLDVKGAGWTAAFPSENISIALDDGNITSTKPDKDYVTEEFELDADKLPHRFDFLGPSIDAGFRIAKNAATDRFSPSAELAYLLAEAWEHNMFSGRFNYHGREVLKGVNRNRPYPMISVETERSPKKREVKTRERVLTQVPEVTALALRDFLKAYMELDNLEVPVIRLDVNTAAKLAPASYERFKASWDIAAKGTAEQDVSVKVSETKGGEEENAPLQTTVMDFAKRFQSESHRAALRNTATHAALIAKTLEEVRLLRNGKRKRVPGPEKDEDPVS